MATLLSSLESQARIHLKETTASFWTSAELVDLFNRGIKDMWGAITDLYEDHYITVDETNVSLAASGTSLTGVPTDVHRVTLIEPRDTTSSGTYRDVLFRPKEYNSHEMINARAMSAQDPVNGIFVYYAVNAAGAPVGAPTIRTAPLLSAAVPLRFVYVPTIPDKVAADANPIPGESDMALIAWAVAYGRVKEREDRSPDPNWLAVYATEKGNILTRLTPRQTQEPEVVGGFFDAQWGG